MKRKKRIWSEKQRERKRRRLANYFARNNVAIDFYIDKYGVAHSRRY